MSSEYSPEEIKALSEFRERLAPHSLPPELLTNPFLIRWLRANKLNITESEKMLLASLEWRKEFKADTILDEEFPVSLLTSIPYAYCGISKEGFAAVISPLGRWDFHGCLEQHGSKLMERKQIHRTEKLFKMINEDKNAKKEVTQTLEIVDLEGFSYGQFFSRRCLEFFLKIAPVMEANYPETLGHSVVINAPGFLNLIFRCLKPFIRQATLDKIQVFGVGEESAWKEVVRERFPVENVPPHWGGPLKGCDEFCTDSNIWMEAPQPEELRRMLEGSLDVKKAS